MSAFVHVRPRCPRWAPTQGKSCARFVQPATRDVAAATSNVAAHRLAAGWRQEIAGSTPTQAATSQRVALAPCGATRNVAARKALPTQPEPAQEPREGPLPVRVPGGGAGAGRTSAGVHAPMSREFGPRSRKGVPVSATTSRDRLSVADTPASALRRESADTPRIGRRR